MNTFGMTLAAIAAFGLSGGAVVAEEAKAPTGEAKLQTSEAKAPTLLSNAEMDEVVAAGFDTSVLVSTLSDGAPPIFALSVIAASPSP